MRAVCTESSRSREESRKSSCRQTRAQWLVSIVTSALWRRNIKLVDTHYTLNYLARGKKLVHEAQYYPLTVLTSGKTTLSLEPILAMPPRIYTKETLKSPRRRNLKPSTMCKPTKAANDVQCSNLIECFTSPGCVYLESTPRPNHFGHSHPHTFKNKILQIEGTGFLLVISGGTQVQFLTLCRWLIH